MEDSLQSLFPVIYAGLAEFPRKQFGILRAVQVDSGLIEGKPSRGVFGQEVVWDVPQIGQAKDIAPAHNVPEAEDDVPAMRSFKMERRRGVQIPVTGATSEVLGDKRLQNQYLQAMDALTLELETYLATKAIAGASRAFTWNNADEDGAYVTPFTNPQDMSYFAEFNRQFKINQRTGGKLSLILNSQTAYNLRANMSNLFRANEFGSREFIADGVLNRIEGFNIHEPVSLPKLPSQSTGVDFTTNGAHAKGMTEIAVKQFGGELKTGDLFQTSIDDSKDYYVITEGVSGDGVIKISEPGLLVDLPNGTGINIIDGEDTALNIGLGGNGIGLGVRLPEAPKGGDAASEALAVHDPYTGMVFEIRRYKRYRMVIDEVAIMYGATVLDPASVILGLTA